MRVLILGGGGMLGHKLGQIYKDRFETWITVRSSFADYERFNLFAQEQTIGGVDAFDFATVVRAFHTAQPDVVINAIGVIKQLPEADDPTISLTINSLFPHRLASLCRASGCRLILLVQIASSTVGEAHILKRIFLMLKICMGEQNILVRSRENSA